MKLGPHGRLLGGTLTLLAGFFVFSSSIFSQAHKRLQLTPAEYQNGEKRALAAYRKALPALRRHLSRQGAELGDPIFLRAFKHERSLEVWVQPQGKGPYKLLKTYPIAAASGNLGPKRREGDRQVPEGFYAVTTALLNPKSRYHLAMNVGYPNSYDRSLGRNGSFIMIHGSNVSAGCLAMTDPAIEEIYTLVAQALQKGQSSIPVHLFPFHLTSRNQAKFRSVYPQHQPFWQNLALGYSFFEARKKVPRVSSSEEGYWFDRE